MEPLDPLLTRSDPSPAPLVCIPGGIRILAGGIRDPSGHLALHCPMHQDRGGAWERGNEPVSTDGWVT
jgi:hypothetical protein